MKLLDALVEQRIAAAAARGELNDLPGSGQPQTFDDDLLVPEEVRVANRILKNAGFVPPAVEQLRALRDIEDALRACDAALGGDAPAGDTCDGAPAGVAGGAQRSDRDAVAVRAEQCRLRAKWLALNMALESLRGGPMVVPDEYRRRVAERLAASLGDGRAAADA